MAEIKRIIEVFAHWQGMEQAQKMGILTAVQLRGKEIFSFAYDKQWLSLSHAQHPIDPDLALYGGPQFLNDGKSNFGVFLDSSPDRWGRLLMRRREALQARLEARKENTLFETDYLLGVYDQHRMGAIRFKTASTQSFLNDDTAMAAPPFTSLRALEEASLALEKDDGIDNPAYLKWLNMLIAPGSSLGGARPKASVIDKQHNLWIAKFPSTHDPIDIGLWEMLVHDLAQQSGIEVPQAMIQKFSSPYHTYLSKRFDRSPTGDRIHFASAMTLLGYTDGTDHQDGASYIELAAFIIKNGVNPTMDLEQLWRRIVFNICVTNTDDHLRNHGFLLTPQGWVLSPAYDINPVPTGTGLKLNISENDNALDLDLALEVSIVFRINATKAKEIIQHIKQTVRQWRTLAQKYRISPTAQMLMEKAFEKAN